MNDNVALVVDDTPANREFLVRLISQTRMTVRDAEDGKSALAAIKGLDSLQLAVVDLQLTDINGLQLTRELRQRFPNTYIVIATMYDDHSLMEKAFASGCNVFLVKPHGFMELFRRLTTNDTAALREGPKVVIDQYGARPFLMATPDQPASTGKSGTA